MAQARGQLGAQSQNEIINTNAALKQGNFELAETIMNRPLSDEEIVYKSVTPKRLPTRDLGQYENKSWTYLSDERDKINEVTRTLSSLGIPYNITNDADGNVVITSRTRLQPGLTPSRAIPTTSDVAQDLDAEVQFLKDLKLSPKKWPSQIRSMPVADLKNIATKLKIVFTAKTTKNDLFKVVRTKISERVPTLTTETTRNSILIDQMPKVPTGPVLTKDDLATEAERELKRLQVYLTDIEDKMDNYTGDKSRAAYRDLVRDQSRIETQIDAIQRVLALKPGKSSATSTSSSSSAAPSESPDLESLISELEDITKPRKTESIGFGVKPEQFGVLFGRYKLLLRPLERNIVKFSTMKSNKAPIPPFHTSKKFIDIIKHAIKHGYIKMSDIKTLDKSEQDILDHIIKRTRADIEIEDDHSVGGMSVRTMYPAVITNKYREVIGNPAYMQDTSLKRRLNTLVGLREGGNTSTAVSNEISAIMNNMLDRGLMSNTQRKNMMQSMAATDDI